MIGYLHKQLVHHEIISDNRVGYLLSGLLLTGVLFLIWLVFVARKQYRIAKILPKGSYTEDITFGWLCMAIIICLGPWIQINVISPILTTILITHIFCGGSVGILGRIPSIRKISNNYEALTTGLIANFKDCRSIKKGFRWGNLSSYISAELAFSKYSERLIFGIFIQSSKIACVLVAVMAFIAGVVSIPNKGVLIIPVQIFAKVGIAIGLNYLFILPCIYVCLELIAARMLLRDPPMLQQQKSARAFVEHFCKEELALYSWGKLLLNLLVMGIIMVAGVFTHVVMIGREMMSR